MAGTGNKSHADEVLAVALSRGCTLTEAAEKAGMSERTARRRRDDPAFAERVRELRHAQSDKAVAAVDQASVKAADTLTELCDSDSERIKLGAARCLLELTFKIREQREVVERLEALEQTLRERGELEGTQ